MTEVDKEAFGARVASRRIKLGMSQTQLAKAVGMKQQGILNIEGGVVERPRRMTELAAALLTTEEWLLWDRGPEDATEGDPDGLLSVWGRLKPARRKLAIRVLKALADEKAA